MIKRIIKYFHRGRAGFTLIELAVAIVITGLISLGASIATGQVLNQSERNNDYTTASHNAVNALYWITRDATMAQTINGTAAFPAQVLSLQWAGWDNDVYTANYTLDGGELWRIYSDGSNIATTLIAENINADPDLTYCTSDNGTFTVTVTGSAGAGAKVIDVTKTRTVSCRPKL